MNTRAFGAVVRRELVRGRRSFLVFTALATIGVFGAVMLSGEGAVIPGIIIFGASMFGLFGPSTELGADKLQGYLEFDRALPMSHILIGAGRLIGVAIRMIPIGLCILPLLVSSYMRHPEAGDVLMLFIAPMGITLIASMLSWVLLAVNARWSLRSMRYVFPLIAFGPQVLMSVLPQPVKETIKGVISDFGDAIAVTASTTGGQIGLIVLALALPGIVFAGATMLYASGLERYKYDPTAINALMTKAPRLELGAMGRGPLLAVTRLRLRIAMDRSSQLLVIAGFLVALFVGPEELRRFARTYVRILAVTLPWGVALQLVPARAKGYLEGMQHIPHDESTVGLGHLLAIAVMAIPGAMILLVARYSDGAAALTLASGVGLWAWFVTGAWVSATGIVWAKAKHLLLLLIPAAALIAWGALNGVGNLQQSVIAMRDGFMALQGRMGVVFPLTILVLAIVIGLPLFARGLRNYEFRGA